MCASDKNYRFLRQEIRPLERQKSKQIFPINLILIGLNKPRMTFESGSKGCYRMLMTVLEIIVKKLPVDPNCYDDHR